MNQAVVIATDPAQWTGWAVFVTGRLVHYGTWKLAADPYDLRFRQISAHVSRAINTYSKPGVPTVVAYEMASFAVGGESESLAGLRAHIVSACGALEVPYEKVAVPTVKKATTGSGRATKDEMRSTVRARYGINELTADEADAIGVGIALHARLELELR